MNRMNRMPREQLEEIESRYMGRSEHTRMVQNLAGRMRMMQIELINVYLPDMDAETRARALLTLKRLRG